MVADEPNEQLLRQVCAAQKITTKLRTLADTDRQERGQRQLVMLAKVALELERVEDECQVQGGELQSAKGRIGSGPADRTCRANRRY